MFSTRRSLSILLAAAAVGAGVKRVTGHEPRSVEDFVREVLAPAARGGR